MSEADDAFLHVHLDHVQPKSRSQDYAITSRSTIWLQISNCANSKDAKKKFVPSRWLKDIPYQEFVLKDKLDKHYAQCMACEIQLFFVFLIVVMVLTKSNTGPHKILIWL